MRRCFYIDEVSGERYPGVASNYLCDLRPDDTLTITGPYGQAFEAPKNPNAALAGSYDFMHLMGHVCLGLMWTRMAKAAFTVLTGKPAPVPVGQ